MKKYLNYGLILFAFSYVATAGATLNVITTLTDLEAIATEVGGSDANVSSIVKGTQDPHYIEAKPSFMTKASRADLVLSIGLDLETAWLPSIIRGARNPKIMPGSQGFLEVGPLLDPLEVMTGKISRSEGDVHPYGNPHVTLDPLRAGKIAVIVAERMAELDPPHAAGFKQRAVALQSRLEKKTKDWQARIQASGVKDVVTYHKTLTYFLDRFQIKNIAMLEPKPGIPPTSGHVLSVIELLKKEKLPLILIENYFDPSVTKKIKEEIPALRSVSVAVAVQGAAGVNSIDELYENLVVQIEGKK